MLLLWSFIILCVYLPFRLCCLAVLRRKLLGYIMVALLTKLSETATVTTYPSHQAKRVVLEYQRSDIDTPEHVPTTSCQESLTAVKTTSFFFLSLQRYLIRMHPILGCVDKILNLSVVDLFYWSDVNRRGTTRILMVFLFPPHMPHN
jgi:hypothetical protein